MVTKRKRFGLSRTLGQGLEETINAAENHSGLMRYEVISLQRIEADPDNPRNLAITPHDIVNENISLDILTKEKQEELQHLKSLADTIKKQGLINPIVVYKHGEKYRLVAGERRFLASLLANQYDIQARVLNEKPSGVNLRLLQWIENTEREDLSLKDRVGNLISIVNEYEKVHSSTQITATILKDLLNVSLPQATIYLAILKAPADIKDSIEKGKINNLDKAAYLAKIDEIPIRRKALEAILQGHSLKHVKTIVEKEKRLATITLLKNNKVKSRGRVAAQVNMGSTSNLHVIKKLVHLVLAQPEYNYIIENFRETDWESFEHTTKAFKLLINILEKENDK